MLKLKSVPLLVAVALLTVGGVAYAAATTISVTADSTSTCAVDGGTPGTCNGSYTVAAGHSLTISTPTPPATSYAPTYVQSNAAVNRNSGLTSSSVSFNRSVTSGNLLVIAVGYRGTPQTLSVTDTLGTSFKTALTPTDSPQTNGPYTEAIYYGVAPAGGSDAVSIQFPTSTGFVEEYVHEYNAANPQLDATSGDTGSGTSITSGSATTNHPSELIFGYVQSNDDVGSAGSGFTERQSVGGDMTEDTDVSSAGSYAATASNGQSVSWNGQMATFYGTGPNNATTPPPPPAAGYDHTVLADGPVASWDMSSSGATEPDLTGNGNTGTYEGGHPSSTTMPNGDTAQDFSGNEYLTIPSNPTFSISTTHTFTWEAWIRPDTLQYSSDYVDWMGKCQNSPTRSCEWLGRMYSSVNSQGRCNRLSAYVYSLTAGSGSGADWQPSCNLLQAGQWLYVVGEYQTNSTPSGCDSSYPGSITIWVNGIQTPPNYPTGCMSQYNASPSAGSAPLNIGATALNNWFPGAIGKVALYNYLLTPAQINAHFTAMTGAQPSGNCNGPDIGQTPSCTIPVPTQ